MDTDGPDNVLGTEDDNLRLLWGSPCVDAGDNMAHDIEALGSSARISGIKMEENKDIKQGVKNGTF